MARITLDIAAPILQEIRDLSKRDGHSRSRIVSELLSEALAARRVSLATTRFHWHSQPMRALVDLTDADAVNEALDE